MKKNKLLNIAIAACKCIQIFYVLMFIALTALFVHVQISPESYKKNHFGQNISSGINFGNSIHFGKYKSWKIDSKADDKEVFTLNKLKTSSLYFIYFKLSAILIFIFLAIREFQKIMQSAKNHKTFQENNIKSFRKIGKYIFIIFLLTSFEILEFQQGGKSGIRIEFTSLILMLISFIMAEIFKEGNLLQQEKDLTI
ncbi:DUF2975 domain-containing protein [uncultured Polaribacter sp.]|uniref:DUF2975 domain-containing protein n=1 Tax=uncultured Polaribacter sp. TaxID=174711 RepID=UPI0026212D7D|nr:DUF2975 domain-containing protein [uncultured Polaribacter sp.]